QESTAGAEGQHDDLSTVVQQRGRCPTQGMLICGPDAGQRKRLLLVWHEHIGQSVELVVERGGRRRVQNDLDARATCDMRRVMRYRLRDFKLQEQDISL